MGIRRRFFYKNYHDRMFSIVVCDTLLLVLFMDTRIFSDPYKYPLVYIYYSIVIGCNILVYLWFYRCIIVAQRKSKLFSDGTNRSIEEEPLDNAEAYDVYNELAPDMEKEYIGPPDKEASDKENIFDLSSFPQQVLVTLQKTDNIIAKGCWKDGVSPEDASKYKAYFVLIAIPMKLLLYVIYGLFYLIYYIFLNCCGAFVISYSLACALNVPIDLTRLTLTVLIEGITLYIIDIIAQSSFTSDYRHGVVFFYNHYREEEEKKEMVVILRKNDRPLIDEKKLPREFSVKSLRESQVNFRAEIMRMDKTPAPIPTIEE